MALSSVTYSGNGSTTSFAIPFPYLFQSDVSVTVNGVTTAFTWTNPALIHIATAPANGTSVFIVRKTNITTLDVVFTDGSTVQASDINTAELQSLYLAQEANDGVSVAIAAAATATAATGAANAAAAAANAAVAGLVPFTGDSGTGGVRGLVPAPTAGSFSAGKFLSAGGSFLVPPGAGVGTNVVTAGADPTGAVDATSVFQTVFTAIGATGGLVVIPPGTYKLLTRPNLPVASGKSVSVLGYGADVSTLFSSSGAGAINATLADYTSTIHIRDLTVTTGAVNTGAGITVNLITPNPDPANNPQNDITNVTVRGSDGYAITNYFTTGIIIAGGASNVNFTNLQMPGNGAKGGTGVLLVGPSVPAGVVYNFTGCTFNFMNAGIQYGTQIQGVTVNQCNFTGGAIGISQTAGSVGAFQLAVTNSQIATTAVGIFIGQQLTGLLLCNNVFSPLANNWAGISGNVTDASIIGNNFINGTGVTGTNGIVTTTGSTGIIISGNTFHGVVTGVLFQAGTTNATLLGNSYNGVTNKSSPATTSGTIVIATATA